MVERHFGLKRRPFPSTPDGATWYPATSHENALTALVRGITADEGFFLLTGEPGAGKTLLGITLLDRLGEGFVSAFLTNSHLADRTALLQAILFDLGLPFESDSEQVLRLRLTDALLTTRGEGRHTLLVVDEAHHLSADLLEELRLLANLESGQGKALQVVLIAQPTIHDTLAQPLLSALKQRLVVRCVLEPLDVEEAFDYLLHHLRIAGGAPEKIIDEGGLEVLAHGTHGIPRLLNQAAYQSLVFAEAGELSHIDAEAALEALSALGLESTCDANPLERVGLTESGDLGEEDEQATLRIAKDIRKSA